MFQEQATERRTQSNKRQRGARSLQTKVWGPITPPKTRQKRRQNGVYLCARYLLFYVLFLHMASISFLGLMPFTGFIFPSFFLFCMIIDVNLSQNE